MNSVVTTAEDTEVMSSVLFQDIWGVLNDLRRSHIHSESPKVGVSLKSEGRRGFDCMHNILRVDIAYSSINRGF